MPRRRIRMRLFPHVCVVTLLVLLCGGVANAGSPGDIAVRFSDQFFPSEGRIVRTVDGTIHAAFPGGSTPDIGTITKYSDKLRENTGYAVVTGLSHDLIQLAPVTPPGATNLDGGLVSGGAYPVRMVYLADMSGADGKTNALALVEEELRQSSRLDLVPVDLSRFFLEREGVVSVKTIPKLALTQFATTLGVDFIVLARAVKPDDEDGYIIHLELLSPAGGSLTTITGSMTLPVLEKHVATPETNRAKGNSVDIDDVRRGAGFLSGRWKGGGAQPKKLSENIMAIRDRVRFSRYEVDGRVKSASFGYTGGVVNRVLVLLFDNNLRIVTITDDKLERIAEVKFRGGLTPISVVSFDVNGDGRDEFYVNSMGKERLESMIIDKTDGQYKVVAQQVPFYFSKTGDGVLLAQKEAGTSVVGNEVFTVLESNGELSYIPAFTLQGKETPMGIIRADLDGDGIPEIAGISPYGRLLIFERGGKLVWKSDRFAFTAKIAASTEKYQIPAPPGVVVVNDEKVGTVLAVGGAIYNEGGTFVAPTYDRGFVRYIAVRASDYVIHDSFQGGQGSVSDLIDVSGGPLGRRDSAGYIRVLSGVMSDSSELIVPLPDSLAR